MRVIIAGSRDFEEWSKSRLFKFLDAYHKKHTITTVVCGMARGVDLYDKDWAKTRHIEVIEMPAEWDKYGKSAGYRRNTDMAEISDALIAIWDGVSKGTVHMINIARAKGLRITVINYREAK